MKSKDSGLSDKVSLHGQLLRYIETLNSQNFRMIAIFSPIITLMSAVIAFFNYTDINFDTLSVLIVIKCSVILIVILSYVGSKAVFNNWQSVMSYQEKLSRISQQIYYISSSEIDLQDVDWSFSGPTTPKEYWLRMKGIVRFRVAVLYSVLIFIAFNFLGVYLENYLLHSFFGGVVSFLVLYFSWLIKALPLDCYKWKPKMNRYLKDECREWVDENMQKFHSEKLMSIYNSESSSISELKTIFRDYNEEYNLNRRILHKEYILAIQEIIKRIVTKSDLRKTSKANLREEIKNLWKTSKSNLCKEIIILWKTSKSELCSTLKEHKKIPKKKLRTEMIEFLENFKEKFLDPILIRKV